MSPLPRNIHVQIECIKDQLECIKDQVKFLTYSTTLMLEDKASVPSSDVICGLNRTFDDLVTRIDLVQNDVDCMSSDLKEVPA